MAEIVEDRSQLAPILKDSGKLDGQSLERVARLLEDRLGLGVAPLAQEERRQVVRGACRLPPRARQRGSGGIQTREVVERPVEVALGLLGIPPGLEDGQVVQIARQLEAVLRVRGVERQQRLL